MTPWFSFWNTGAAIVKPSKFGVMFNYWNVSVQREVRLLTSRSLGLVQVQPSCFGCHQSRNDVEVMKLNYNIKVKNTEKQR